MNSGTAQTCSNQKNISAYDQENGKTEQQIREEVFTAAVRFFFCTVHVINYKLCVM
jgi:hypothetical protein